MKRKIIQIDQEKCNGCGKCVSACAEGAIELVNGKARLVKDQYCDGLGACIGKCPVDAIEIIEREADPFDEKAALQHAAGVQKDKKNGMPASFPHSGCPGSRMAYKENNGVSSKTVYGLPEKINESALSQWPVQLHLVPVNAPFFQDNELVVLSTCGPVASADIHWRFLRGRSVVVACPKLDRTETYIEKLSEIFRLNNIPKVIIARMEVPCCGGLTHMAQTARQMCGKEDFKLEEAVIRTDGSVKRQIKI